MLSPNLIGLLTAVSGGLVLISGCRKFDRANETRLAGLRIVLSFCGLGLVAAGLALRQPVPISGPLAQCSRDAVTAHGEPPIARCYHGAPRQPKLYTASNARGKSSGGN
jgi:hypothetical protein